MDRESLVAALKSDPIRKLTGPPEHWLTTFHTGFWGLTESQRGKWEELQPGDLFVFHSTYAKYVSAKHFGNALGRVAASGWRSMRFSSETGRGGPRP